MRISSIGGLVAVYINTVCAVKTRSDGYMYPEEMAKWVLKEIEHIKRSKTSL